MSEEDIFGIGDIIGGKFKVCKRLGRGGYGEIYACKTLATKQIVAVKVERVCKPGNLLEEEQILRDLKQCTYVPHVILSGRHENKVNFIAMNLLGENLSTYRRRQNGHTFSLLTTLMLGMQMLRAIKEVHDAGYLHRDIKPGNFVMGSSRDLMQRTVIMIDYGLSRKYVNDDGTVKPKRAEAKWVGSRRYMSLNTHMRKEQGRRDDLMGLLYVLVEFITGTLPWGHLRGIENLDKVKEIKAQFNNENLVRGLPNCFVFFLNHTKNLSYAQKPDYEALHESMNSQFKSAGGNANTPFDWESPEDVEYYNKCKEGLIEVDNSDTSSDWSSESPSPPPKSKNSRQKTKQAAPSSSSEGDCVLF